MKRIIVTWIVIICAIPLACAQGQSKEEITNLAQELVNEMFPEQRGAHAHVMLLGTFHFKDAGLDGYKPQHAIDVFAPERQREIEAIADSLVAFKPTKIGVERKPETADALQVQYDAYLRDELDVPANEIYQLGFRVARKMGHDGVHPIDAPGRSFGNAIDITDFAREHDQTRLLGNAYRLSFLKLGQKLDAMKLEQPLRDHLLLLNEPALLKVQHGTYLPRALGLRDGDDYPKADGFVSSWYNRNLRIVGNLQHIIESEEERIVVIIGAGHLPILRHLVQSSPNLTLVEPSDFL